MKEIIVFFIDGNEYGIEISGMQSLENYREVVSCPDVPECILGTVTIRDEIYPVFDIRAKLSSGTNTSAKSLPSEDSVTEDTKIILLRTDAGNIACVVDRVGKVFRAEGENVQPFPAVARTKDTSYIDFVAKRNNELIVVIDPNALLTPEESDRISKIDFSGKQEK